MKKIIAAIILTATTLTAAQPAAEDVRRFAAGGGSILPSPHGTRGESKNMDEKKLDRLYDLLERLEDDGDVSTAAALREAILKIEGMNH